MQALLLTLFGYLLQFAKPLIGRVLLALGIGFVTYKGVGTATDFLVNQIKTNMAGLPSEIVDFLAFCWVDKGLGMIFSTWTACIAVSGLAGGLTKFKIKGGA
jgi:hypothetical protein